ncbi:MAG: ubiquitin-conjugating enzyme E2 [Bacillota bacterium]
MSIRLRRLMSDYDKIRNEFAGHKYIKFIPMGGNPPERYRIVYNVTGLVWDDRQNCPVELQRHEVEIYLPNEYPRGKPLFVIHTPIFHPNFSANRVPNQICVGDHWAASSSLADQIVKVGEMLQYRDYNVKSPLNAMAARWALENEKYLPVGKIDLFQAEPEVELSDMTAEPEKKAEAEDDLDIALF